MGEKEEHDEMQQNVCVSMLRNIVRRSHKISNDSFNFLEIFDTISSHNFRRFFFPVSERIVFPFQEILFITGSVTNNWISVTDNFGELGKVWNTCRVFLVENFEAVFFISNINFSSNQFFANKIVSICLSKFYKLMLNIS